MKKFYTDVCIMQVEEDGFASAVYLVYEGRGGIGLPEKTTLFEVVRKCLERHCDPNEVAWLAETANEDNTRHWYADTSPIERATDMVATALEAKTDELGAAYTIGRVMLWLTVPDNE